MDEGNSERYMKRRLTILEGKEEQDDSEQVGGGYFFSESLKIDLKYITIIDIKETLPRISC